jgi:hypothetical protein
VALEAIRRIIPQLQHIRKLFVEPLQGNTGEINRERIIALVATRGRFQVVETQEQADAIIRGLTESSEIAKTVTTSEETKAKAVVGGINTIAAGAARSNTNTSETTKPILTETVLLRLTLKSGETLWAWDDTKRCSAPRTTCAVEDLVDAAGN